MTPVSATEAQRVMTGKAGLSYADGQKQALEGADALLIVTEWKGCRTPVFEAIRDSIKNQVVFDDRKLYEPELIQLVRADLPVDWAQVISTARKNT